jgi:hypothetical protein
MLYRRFRKSAESSNSTRSASESALSNILWQSIEKARVRQPVAQIGRHVGHAAIREFVIEKALNATVTVHQEHTPILDIISETEASGIWAMEDSSLVSAKRLHVADSSVQSLAS